MTKRSIPSSSPNSSSIKRYGGHTIPCTKLRYYDEKHNSGILTPIFIFFFCLECLCVFYEGKPEGLILAPFYTYLVHLFFRRLWPKTVIVFFWEYAPRAHKKKRRKKRSRVRRITLQDFKEARRKSSKFEKAECEKGGRTTRLILIVASPARKRKVPRGAHYFVCMIPGTWVPGTPYVIPWYLVSAPYSDHNGLIADWFELVVLRLTSHTILQVFNRQNETRNRKKNKTSCCCCSRRCRRSQLSMAELPSQWVPMPAQVAGLRMESRQVGRSTGKNYVRGWNSKLCARLKLKIMCSLCVRFVQKAGSFL